MFRFFSISFLLLCLLRNECNTTEKKLKTLSLQTQLQHNCTAKRQHIWQSHSITMLNISDRTTRIIFPPMKWPILCRVGR